MTGQARHESIHVRQREAYLSGAAVVIAFVHMCHLHPSAHVYEHSISFGFKSTALGIQIQMHRRKVSMGPSALYMLMVKLTVRCKYHELPSQSLTALHKSHELKVCMLFLLYSHLFKAQRIRYVPTGFCFVFWRPADQHLLSHTD